MNEIIAIPVSEDVLDQHFGHCKCFALIKTNENKIINQTLVEAPLHEPGKLPKWLKDQEVTKVIAGGIGNKAVVLFSAYNIQVLSGAPAITPQLIVEQYLNKTLVTTSNSCDH